jgi:hypothetical protein
MKNAPLTYPRLEVVQLLGRKFDAINFPYWDNFSGAILFGVFTYL